MDERILITTESTDDAEITASLRSGGYSSL